MRNAYSEKLQILLQTVQAQNSSYTPPPPLEDDLNNRGSKGNLMYHSSNQSAYGTNNPIDG